MAIVVNIDGNDGVRFLSNGQNWSGRQMAMTIAKEQENRSAKLVPYLSSGLRECHVQVSVLIEIPKGDVAF